jgi:hypothetical protein
MRPHRENLRAYYGLAAMGTLTAPGVDAGLVWDRSQCKHGPDDRCGKPHGCKVVPAWVNVAVRPVFAVLHLGRSY